MMAMHDANRDIEAGPRNPTSWIMPIREAIVRGTICELHTQID
jgi:hypothetical protein